jgi:hypothetical protein
VPIVGTVLACVKLGTFIACVYIGTLDVNTLVVIL